MLPPTEIAYNWVRDEVSQLMERYFYAFHEHVVSLVRSGVEPVEALHIAHRTLQDFRKELRRTLAGAKGFACLALRCPYLSKREPGR